MKATETASALGTMSEQILSLSPLFHRIFSPEMEKSRMEAGVCNKNQEKALLILLHSDRIIPSRLGTFLNLQRGSLTSLVDSLERLGFVHRAPDGEDRRKIHIELTAAGKTYIDGRYAMLGRRIEESVSSMDPGLRREFAEGLDTVIRGLRYLEEHRENMH